MTLIVSWIGIDTHGPASAYIVGDSRISWNRNNFFNYGKKVFSSIGYPEIFGYAGDVLFPSIVLAQIVEMIDSNILFDKSHNCDQKNQMILEKLSHSFSKYPKEVRNYPIQIIHISRDTIVNGYPDFHCYFLNWAKNSGWKKIKKDIPKESNVLFVLGSGGKEFQENYKKYQKGPNKNTSRNVFHCFCDTLLNIKDKCCGGPPQMVGIYRKANTSSINFGVIHNNKRFFLGSEVPKASYFDRIEWRNEYFELCNGKTKKKIDKAMKQPDLLRRK